MITRYSLFDKFKSVVTKSKRDKDIDISSVLAISKDMLLTSYEFCADNVYLYIAEQVAFGPRIPGTKPSIECALWIVNKLKEFGAVNIEEQHFQAIAYNGDILNGINISAQINPNVENRILLFAHWDSRPWADCDKNPLNRNKPIDGANDGASGVGVILELLRIFAHNHPTCGIDILFIDAEDYGQRIDEPSNVYDDYSWCLGMQHWISNPTLPLFNVHFAILLDMVGGQNTIFQREYFSQYSSNHLNDMVWHVANQTGNALYFVEELGNPIIDDHVFLILNQLAAIAIIGSQEKVLFNSTWHTLDDTIKHIDCRTIKAVGETLEQLFVSYFA